MKKATTYKGSAIKYIADVIIPQLPDSERLRIIRKSKNVY